MMGQLSPTSLTGKHHHPSNPNQATPLSLSLSLSLSKTLHSASVILLGIGGITVFLVFFFFFLLWIEEVANRLYDAFFLAQEYRLASSVLSFFLSLVCRRREKLQRCGWVCEWLTHTHACLAALPPSHFLAGPIACSLFFEKLLRCQLIIKSYKLLNLFRPLIL
jgi:hypothetical protein